MDDNPLLQTPFFKSMIDGNSGGGHSAQPSIPDITAHPQPGAADRFGAQAFSGRQFQKITGTCDVNRADFADQLARDQSGQCLQIGSRIRRGLMGHQIAKSGE